MNVRIKLGVVAASVAALALSACGSSSLSGEPGGGTAPSVSVSQNVDLASKLPESIKNAGLIKIGVDASYAWPATARLCKAWTSTCSMR
jgi:polar amino acid transport system substrate-binding protein